MITIDPKSGILTLDDYQFNPHETIDKLLAKYTSFQFNEKESGLDNLFYRAYNLPPSDLDARRIEGRMTSSVQYMSSISFVRMYKIQKRRKYYSKYKKLDWVKTAQNWLLNELGQPHEIESGILFDEDKHFNASELEFFKSWKYKFEWGTAGFYYDGLQLPGSIYIHYDYHYQIKSWDELLYQLDYIELEAPKYQLINRTNIQAVRELIHFIRDEFDYMTIRPRVGVQSLHFKPQELHPNFVTVTIDVNRPSKLYRIMRSDRANMIFTSDRDILLKGLKEFFRAKP